MLPGITSDLGFEAGVVPPYTGGSSDTQTVTAGADGTAINANRRRGFILGALGSCNSGNSALYGGAVIRELACEEDDGVNVNYDLIFTVTGSVANSGWNNITVGSQLHVFSRSSATFSSVGGNSVWTWFGVGNLFGSSGTVTTVGFS